MATNGFSPLGRVCLAAALAEWLALPGLPAWATNSNPTRSARSVWRCWRSNGPSLRRVPARLRSRYLVAWAGSVEQEGYSDGTDDIELAIAAAGSEL